MPEDFNPSWEYYTPDPEIEEIINENGHTYIRDKFAAIADYDNIGNQGYRFDRRKTATYPDRPCIRCGAMFPPIRITSKRCPPCAASRDTRPWHKRKLKPRMCQRPDCDKRFQPRWGLQVYCNYQCSKAAREQIEQRYHVVQLRRQRIHKGLIMLTDVRVSATDTTQVFHTAEDAVLYLLEFCKPEFLGKLKSHGLRRIQNRLNGIVENPNTGAAAVPDTIKKGSV